MIYTFHPFILASPEWIAVLRRFVYANHLTFDGADYPVREWRHVPKGCAWLVEPGGMTPLFEEVSG